MDNVIEIFRGLYAIIDTIIDSIISFIKIIMNLPNIIITFFDIFPTEIKVLLISTISIVVFVYVFKLIKWQY